MRGVALISQQINPDFTLAQSFSALKLIFVPKRAVEEKKLQTLFGSHPYWLTNSGRTALRLWLKTEPFPRDLPLGIPAFMCGVVASAAQAEGYRVAWLDTNERGCLTVPNLENFRGKLGAVLLPHIFGQKLDLPALTTWAKAHQVKTVEDTAHYLPSASEPLLTDARIYSFGREKALSIVCGGALITDAETAEKITPIYQSWDFPNWWWTTRHLTQPFWLSICLPWWRAGGKILAGIISRLRILPRAITPAEKKGQSDFPLKKMPIAPQILLTKKIEQWELKIQQQKKLYQAWEQFSAENLSAAQLIPVDQPVRFVLRCPNPEARQRWQIRLRALGYDSQDWDGVPISPASFALDGIGYTLGTAPQAEEFARHYLTLPMTVRATPADIKKLAQQW